MAQTQRLLLAHKEDVCHVGDAKALFQRLFLAGLCQLFFQLRAAVKVVLNDALVAAQNDEDIGDAGTHSFFHQILDGRLVHNGQHTLGHGLGSGQHAGAKTGGRDDGFGDFLHHDPYSPITILKSAMPAFAGGIADQSIPAKASRFGPISTVAQAPSTISSTKAPITPAMLTPPCADRTARRWAASGNSARMRRMRSAALCGTATWRTGCAASPAQS